MNLLTAGIPLGRWFGIRVNVHWTFLLLAFYWIRSAPDPQAQAMFLGVLFGTVLLHEFGHSLACRSVGGRADYIVLWPLGGLAFCAPPPRPWPQLWTTVAGPLVNMVLIPLLLLLHLFVLPLMPPQTLAYSVVHRIVEDGLPINIFLLMLNLLPVFPLDGGRIVQEILWFFVGYPRSLLIAGMLGTVGGIGFVVLGLGLVQLSIPIPFLDASFHLGGGENWQLIFIGIMAAMESWRVYQQAQQIQGWQRR
jgi:Zn-dependent protease